MHSEPLISSDTDGILSGKTIQVSERKRKLNHKWLIQEGMGHADLPPTCAYIILFHKV